MNKFQQTVIGLREAGHDYVVISKHSGIPFRRILDCMHWNYSPTTAEMAKLMQFVERTKPGALPPRRLRVDDRKG